MPGHGGMLDRIDGIDGGHAPGGPDICIANRPQQLAILGSTGSIGVNTLDVVARHRERFQVVALAAHRQLDLLFRQCAEFNPPMR